MSCVQVAKEKFSVMYKPTIKGNVAEESGDRLGEKTHVTIRDVNECWRVTKLGMQKFNG